MIGKKRGLLGIDIGSSSIKISLLEGSKGNVKVKEIWKTDLPEEAIAEGEIIERDVVIEVLQRFIQERKPPIKNIATFIPNPRAISIKRVKMDKLPLDELKEQIKWQAEQYFGVDPTEISVDGDIVNPEVSETEVEVLIVAARNDAVTDYVHLIKSAGFIPRIIDVKVLALYNLFEFNYPEIAKNNDLKGILHIGKNFATMFFFIDTGPYLIRDIRTNLKSLINLMQEKLDLSYTDSLLILKGEKEVSSTFVYEVYRDYVSALSDEIRRIFPYLEKKDFPDVIYVSGGGTLIKDFTTNLSESLGVKVERLNPFERIDLPESFLELGSKEVIGALFAPSFGLSLRGIL
ncbi:MAG: type IV pilus assembly protein PilM [Candidatus Hydrothermales bacterium]